MVQDRPVSRASALIPLLALCLGGLALGACDGGHESHGATRARPGVAPPAPLRAVDLEKVPKLTTPPPDAKPREPRPRPEEDLARDADRKPQEVMDFFGIAPGMTVAELMTGRGYYAELLSRRVGPEGKVLAHNTPFVMQRFAEKPLKERTDNPALANVEVLDTELEDPGLASNLDAVLMINFYHDLYWQEVDRKRMNERIFEALKPGGVYGVIDHRAAKASKDRDVKTLHRVDERMVRLDIEKAGFVLEQRSDLLTHEEDDRTLSAFDPSIRGKTDRFVHLYRKPADATD